MPYAEANGASSSPRAGANTERQQLPEHEAADHRVDNARALGEADIVQLECEDHPAESTESDTIDEPLSRHAGNRFTSGTSNLL